MSVYSYRRVEANLDKNCWFCLGPADENVLAHEGAGRLHPVHKPCLTLTQGTYVVIRLIALHVMKKKYF